MTVKQGPYIFINSENLAEADFMSRNFVNKEIRNRAFINTLGAEALIKYLTTENVNLKNIRNIHSVARVLEYVDIADIMMPNIHIDVRVVFDENQIFIPKSHFEYEIQPDIYVVLKLGENFEYFELMGFFEPRSINMSHENSQYYFYENYKLSSPGHLVKFIKTYAKRAPESITEEELLKGRELSVNLADHDITENEFKTLLKLMASSTELRDSILEYDNFETLSHRVAPLLGDEKEIGLSAVETADDTEVESGLENDSDEDFDSDEEQSTEEELAEDSEESEESEEIADEAESDALEEHTEEIASDDDTNTEAESDVLEEHTEEIASDDDTNTEAESETPEELFGQDLTFDTENIEDISVEENNEEVLPAVENIDITDAEEDDEENQEEINEITDTTVSESTTSEEADNDEETLDFDTAFFDQNNDDVLELTDDFFAEEDTAPTADKPQDKTDDGGNIVSDIIKTGAETATGIAEIATSGMAVAAGAQLSAGVAASAEAINLAAVAGSEIEDIKDDNIDNIFDNSQVPDEINTNGEELENSEISDLEIDKSSQIQDDSYEDFDEGLILDETDADTSDLGDLVETFDDIPLDTETTVNFDELETTSDIPQVTQNNEDVTVDFENLEDLSVNNQDEIEAESIDLSENFTDFSNIDEVAQFNEPVQNELTDETRDFDTLTQIPETTGVVSDTSVHEQEIAEETVNFEDLGSLTSEAYIPEEIIPEAESEQDVLQDMSAFENQESTSDFSYAQSENSDFESSGSTELQADIQEDELPDSVPEQNTEDYSSFGDINQENRKEDESEYTFDFAANDDWEANTDEQPYNDETAENDFSFEELSSEPEITDEDVPQHVNQETTENSAAISNMEFNPGEIPIDINNNEPTTYDEAEHLESIYNDSGNFQNSALNNSARFVRGGNASQNGQSKLFAVIAGLLVLVVIGVLGMSAFKMFKPSAQNELQPITDNQFPEIPQNTGAEGTPTVDTGKVVTMTNTNPAPVAQPAVQTQNSATNKIPATSFLEISKLSWEVPDYISANANFKRYFQSAGKSLKAGLSSDLLLAKDYVYSKQMRLSVTFDKNGAFKESRMLMSSGSTQIDNIVLQSVNQTLSVLKAPNSLGNDQSTTVILKIYF